MTEVTDTKSDIAAEKGIALAKAAYDELQGSDFKAVRDNAAILWGTIAALNQSASDELLRTKQAEVARWMHSCFGPAISEDRLERADRFIEESLELAQTCPAFTADRAHALVDYVFGRPVGQVEQEIGGVMVTLAALCNTGGYDIQEAMNTEVARIWTKVDAIRAKQATKPTGSALPTNAHLSTGGDHG